MTNSKESKARTLRQNSALHLWFTQISEELNGAGLTMQKTLEQAMDIPWTETSIKEVLWKPIMKAMFNKNSTAKLNSDEITKIYEAINLITAKMGVHVAFPSIDSLMLKMAIKNEYS